MTEPNVLTHLRGELDGMLAEAAGSLTLAELDAIVERSLQPGALIPHHVAADLARYERQRRRQNQWVRHALAGYPLGRPNHG